MRTVKFISLLIMLIAYTCSSFDKVQSQQKVLTHEGTVLSVAISPDNRYILTSSNDKTAKLREVESGKEIFTLKEHTDQVNSVAFSPDGTQFLTGSSDGKTILRDRVSGRPINILEKPVPVWSVTFSPNAKQIAIAAWLGVDLCFSG